MKITENVFYERNEYLVETSSLRVKRMYKSQVAEESLRLLGSRQDSKGVWVLKERRQRQNWCCRRREVAGGKS